MKGKLQYFRELEERYRRELAHCPAGYMIRTRTCSGTWNYAEVKKIKGKYVRRGITKNREAVYRYARKRFLQEMIKILEANCHAMERFVETYREIDPGMVIESLPHTYDDLPVEAFFPLAVIPNWAGEDYPKNPLFPEHLRHITLKGYKVRSKSELYIASQLDQYEIPFRYEMGICLGNKKYYPDFTMRNPQNGQLIYWEHCGMVGDERYMDSHYDKMRIYGKYGIVPWKNLIVTYDDEEGNINAQDIDRAIQGLVKTMGLWRR